jgi:hypothetical protein
MTIEIWGRRRHGKTKMGLALCLYFKYVLGMQVYTTEKRPVELGIFKKLTKEILLTEEDCVFWIPEFWREMDSQDWKNPNSRLMTHWWQLQGHKNIIFIYDTQLRSQMNNRIRESNDYSIYCEKKKLDRDNYKFKYMVFDGVSFDLLRTWNTTTEKERFLYSLYDTLGNNELILS